MSSAFFTRPPARYKVPHDRIGLRWVLVAHLAVTRAFELIRAEGFILSSTLENDITIKLENVLNNRVLNRLEVDDFDSGFFGKVRRVEVVNHDETKKSKKPDLCFDLQRETRVDWDQLQDALFAECKPIDKKHLLKDHYCAVEKDCTGVERFVIGDYAWAMEEALMIGYVRNGFTLHHLAAALQDATKMVKLGNPTTPIMIEAIDKDGNITQLCQTTHKRLFSWRNGQTATPIDLFHSWHSCE
jgi:hypothetical protein